MTWALQLLRPVCSATMQSSTQMRYPSPDPYLLYRPFLKDRKPRLDRAGAVLGQQGTLSVHGSSSSWLSQRLLNIGVTYVQVKSGQETPLSPS
jgi:hypothetical protein